MNAISLRILTAVVLQIFVSVAIAQNLTDTLHIKGVTAIKDKFIATKMLNLQYEQASSSDYKMKMRNNKYENGSIKNMTRINARFILPVIAKKKFVVLTSWGYKYEAADFDNTVSTPIGVPTLRHGDREETHFFRGAATFMLFDKLFGKDIFYSASLITDGSQKGFESINGAFAATMTLRKTEHCLLAIGLFGSTSRAAIFPFLPILSYTHRFTQSAWTIDAALPGYAYLRRHVGKSGRFSGGMMIDSNTSYLYPRQDGLKKLYTFNYVDIKGVAMYEHFLTKNILVNARMGVSKCYIGVLREKNRKRDIAELSQKANLFFDVGISYTIGN